MNLPMFRTAKFIMCGAADSAADPDPPARSPAPHRLSDEQTWSRRKGRMGSLEPIELSRHISQRLPGAELSVDAPQNPSGNWYVDVQFENYLSVIEWRPRLDFGVSLEVAGYGEGPEMVFSSAIEAADYLAAKLTHGRP